MFKRILVANRGEIAVRVIRAAHEMGIEAVAVYSDFDHTALHTRMADLAVALGGQLPADSYLNGDKIIAAAKESGAEAIHPGYGFLAENAAFAQKVTEAGLTWIGPPPKAIEAMGDKIESRRCMNDAKVPIVPGIADPIGDPAEAVKVADEIGYPVALKAAAGGGGKGIRIVRDPDGIEAAFRTASGEAAAAFGDGRLYLERYLERPRHIEVQVLFDQHGNGVHLGERECSIQRRHQKLIEECPSPVITPELRAEMGEVALRAARAVDYEGAGTVEFLYTEASGKPEFFFLEMNTRLQVEHPVTEMVTSIDLVREQLRVAAGEELGYGQDAIEFHGWAIEVRINAEDPTNEFLPSTGTIGNLRWPGGPWIRIDSGLYRGMEVGLNYDPMLAKIIAWGVDRDVAIRRMRRALQELNVGGVRTGAPAALHVLEDERFQKGDIDTGLLERMQVGGRSGGHDEVAAVAAALNRWLLSRRDSLASRTNDREGWLARERRLRTPFPPTLGPTSQGGAQ